MRSAVIGSDFFEFLYLQNVFPVFLLIYNFFRFIGTRIDFLTESEVRLFILKPDCKAMFFFFHFLSYIVIVLWKILTVIFFQDNPELFLSLVDLAYSASPFDEAGVLEAFDYALSNDHLSEENKLRFSQRKLDFLEDLGSDISRLVLYLFCAGTNNAWQVFALLVVLVSVAA